MIDDFFDAPDALHGVSGAPVFNTGHGCGAYRPVKKNGLFQRPVSEGLQNHKTDQWEGAYQWQKGKDLASG